MVYDFNMINKDLIPTTVIMGFLGSGKTTIIMSLVEHLAKQKQKVVYIKNEVGAADLDTKLMKGKVTDVKELLNGCICCTLVGSLVNSIDELIDKYQPDRFIIESAGTADPASMALAVSSHPRLSRDGVISIIDVVNFDGYEDLNMVARRQAEFTDLIVFNKVEQVDQERKKAVVGYVRELNEKSPIVEAQKGKLDPGLAFGLDIQFDQKKVDHHQSDQDGVEAFSLVETKPISKKKFDQFLNELPKNVIRIKGLVLFADGEKKVLNGISRRFDFFDSPVGLEIKQTELILIGYMIASLKADLREKIS